MKSINIQIPREHVIDEEKSSLSDGIIVFKKCSIVEQITDILKENDCYNLYLGKTVKVEQTQILIPLPSANDDWTFQAYNLCKRICNLFTNAYPVHYDDNDNADYIYIEVAGI